jgi:quinohemoprotein ethanol dehydrogenase
MQAPKNGFFYVLDRTDGTLLSARPLVPTTWADRIDPLTGRPVENSAARYGHAPVLVSPGAGGAHNFNPLSYNPVTGLVYLALDRSFTIFSTLGFAPAGYEKQRAGLAAYAAAHEQSWLAAWDPVGGRIEWRVPYPQSGSGGTLSTAGDLVFQGTIRKTFVAYRATDGKRLWQKDVQTVPIAGPMTYAVDGEQYIAVNAGWGGGRAHVQSTSFQELQVSAARLLVFKLGGNAELPPLAHGDEAPPAPPALMSPPTPAALRRGTQLYAQHCAMCHGVEARGGIKDLRHMTPETHAHFIDIVLGGIRQKAGMASFAGLLSKADAELIHDYLIVRANDDWGTQEHGAR